MTRLSLLTLLFASSSSSLAVVDSSTDYDCSQGCSMDPSEMGPSVCGVDGISYWNECIAYCQNVQVLHSGGSCYGEGGRGDGSSGIDDDTDDMDERANVSVQDMNRFSQDGFRLVGKRDPDRFAPRPTEPVSPPAELEDDATNVFSERRDLPPTRALRITSDGLEYISEYTIDELEDFPSAPASQQGDARNLVVIGGDTRTKIGNTQTFPYSAICEMDYGFGLNEGGCTATLISRTSVLTAAHCVYDRTTDSYTSHLRLAPGRFKNAQGVTEEPFGLWAIEYTTVFSQWKGGSTQESTRYDIAVVKYQSKVTEQCDYFFPGDAAGYVGLSRPSVFNDRRLADATISGYPKDTEGNSGELYSSGACPSSWIMDPPNFAFHYCDTEAGQSGSAVLTTDHEALGVHAYGYESRTGTATKNGAVLMTGSALYNAIYSWSDRNNNLPSCNANPSPTPPTPTPPTTPSPPTPSGPCPCENVRFFILRVVCYFFYSAQCSA